jgi:transposase
VDIAKASLQVDLRGRSTSVNNDRAGCLALCKKLKAIAGAHVICEATGGYEEVLLDALHEAHIPVSVINPARARAAAQAKGQRAKSDPIDAAGLTEYGERYNPEPTAPPSKVQRQLMALIQWLRQLIEAQAAAKAQAEHHADAFVRKQHEALLAHYEKQISATEKKLKELLESDPELKERAMALDEIEGVGLRTALVMLSHMPELGQLNRQEVAALAGLAPWTRDSGKLKGVRCIGGGRPEVRVALYMCSLSAIRHNRLLREFYERLIGKGKPTKVALTAVMRKLVVYMNRKLKLLRASGVDAKNEKKAA